MLTLSAAAAVLFVIAAGQSNSVGMAAVPSSLSYANEGRITVYTNAATWQTPAREPLDSAAGQVDTVSADPQAGAGYVLPAVDSILAQRPNDVAVIIPCARGGSSITEWQRDLRRDTLYGSCLARYQEAVAGWQAQTGTGPDDVVVMWWQGEVDAKAGEVFTTSWLQRFQRLRTDWRADTGVNAAWVLGVLKPDAPAGYPAWAKIRGYQIAAQDEPRTQYFGTGTVPYDSSGLHPTLTGYQAIAVGAGKAYLRTLP